MYSFARALIKSLKKRRPPHTYRDLLPHSVCYHVEESSSEWVIVDVWNCLVKRVPVRANTQCICMFLSVCTHFYDACMRYFENKLHDPEQRWVLCRTSTGAVDRQEPESPWLLQDSFILKAHIRFSQLCKNKVTDQAKRLTLTAHGSYEKKDPIDYGVIYLDQSVAVSTNSMIGFWLSLNAKDGFRVQGLNTKAKGDFLVASPAKL